MNVFNIKIDLNSSKKFMHYIFFVSFIKKQFANLSSFKRVVKQAKLLWSKTKDSVPFHCIFNFKENMILVSCSPMQGKGLPMERF